MNTELIKRRRGMQYVKSDAGDVITELQQTFHQFMADQNTAIEELKKGKSDPVLSEKIDRLNSRISELDGIKSQLANVENAIARGDGGLPGGGSSDNDEYSKDFTAYFKTGQVSAALQTASDPDGGYLVPEEVEKGIERVAEVESAMRRLARVRKIGTDTYKKLVNAAGASSGWVGERASRAETDTPILKEIAINTKELYANPAVTQSLIDDSSIDIGEWLGGEIDVEFAEQEGGAFITGNGVEQPRGILDYTHVANASYAWGSIGHVVTGHATLIDDTDALIDLQHALKSKYRNSAKFLMADSTVQAIRKLKDGDSNYIFRPGIALDQPSTLLGKAIETDDNMPTIAANAYAIAFANFKRAYTIIDRIGIRILRDPYTNKPYVHFYTTKRVGGGVTMFEAIKLLKVSA